MTQAKRGEQAISDDAVRAKTGRTWKQWLTTLDKWGAKTKSHAEIARHLHETHTLSGWWAQTVTVRYEQERGLRKVGQRRTTGAYEVSVQRLIRTSQKDAYNAFIVPALLNKWFTKRARVNAIVGGAYSNADGDRGTFTFLAPHRRIRFTWDNPKHCPESAVEVTFTKSGAGKTGVRVTHLKLKSQKEREEMRGGWSWALDSLKSFLETGKPIRHEDWLKSKTVTKGA